MEKGGGGMGSQFSSSDRFQSHFSTTGSPLPKEQDPAWKGWWNWNTDIGQDSWVNMGRWFHIVSHQQEWRRDHSEPSLVQEHESVAMHEGN